MHRSAVARDPDTDAVNQWPKRHSLWIFPIGVKVLGRVLRKTIWKCRET